MTLAVQTIGRPFRRFSPTKTEVFCFNYTPDFTPVEEADSVKDVLTQRTNALLISMMLDESLHPILLPKLPGDRRKSKYETVSSFFIGIGVSPERLKAELLEFDTDVSNLVDERTEESVNEAIMEILEGLGVKPDDMETALAGANLMMTKMWSIGHASEVIRFGKDPRLKGIDISSIRYDKLMEFFDHTTKSIVFTGSFAERDLRELKNRLMETMDARLDRILSDLGVQ